MENANTVSRRSFLKGSGVAAVGMAAMGLTSMAANKAFADELNAPGLPEWDYEADVVVVGFGFGGIGAACAAADAGASVILLEKAPEEEAGGASRINGGFITISEEYNDVDYCWRNLKGVYDKEVLQAHLDDIELMEDFIEDNEIEGLEYAEWPGYVGYYNPSGMWKSYPSFAEAVTSRGVDVYYETPAVKLIQHPETQEVVGVWATEGDNLVAVKANKGVILATGSYGSNLEMVHQFNYPDVFVASYDSPYNTGDGLYMAAQAGAKLGGFFPDSLEWEHFALKVPSEECGTGVMWQKPANDLAHFVFVNRLGQRFFDESTNITHTRDHLPMFDWVGARSRKEGEDSLDDSEVTNDYLNSPFWVVFDQEMFDGMRLGNFTEKEEIYGDYGTAISMSWNGVYKYAPWSQDNAAELEKGWIVAGETLEELAANMKATNFYGDEITVNADGLAATVAAYNDGCAAGEDEFGRAAETLQPLGDGPYYAAEMCLASMYGYGGPMIDVNNNVVDVDGDPIPRLWVL